MILVDANVLMYAAGAEHPCKAPCIQYLESIASGQVEAAIDAETLQEILHRYRALKRWDEGRMVFGAARRIFPLVIPVTAEILDRARSLLDELPDLMARDALHAAVVKIHDLEGICSYDQDFDAVPGLRRIEPDPGQPIAG